VRHATLIRPLGENGKLKLAADMAQLELAVAPLISIKDLGEPYKILRALRPFIFKELKDILTCQELQVLPPVISMHHLFCRSPKDLPMPHELLGLSFARYSEWLDTHDQKQVWAVLSECLTHYQNLVNKRGDKEFPPLFPVLVELKKLFEQK